MPDSTSSAAAYSAARSSSSMPRAIGRARGFVLDRVLRRPVLFTDRRGLSYMLFPGENARVYFACTGRLHAGSVDLRLCGLLDSAGRIAWAGTGGRNQQVRELRRAPSRLATCSG